MNRIVVACVVLTFLLVTACASGVPTEKQCTVDSDCVQAQCCHATDAVNKEYGPDCNGIFCTLSCEPGTLDCGQGEIKCVEGACTAILDN